MSLRLKKPTFRAPLIALIVAPLPLGVLILVPAALQVFGVVEFSNIVPDGVPPFPLSVIVGLLVVGGMALALVYPIGVPLAWAILLHWIWISRNKVFSRPRQIVFAVYWRPTIGIFVLPAMLLILIGGSIAFKGQPLFSDPRDSYMATVTTLVLIASISAFLSTIPAYWIFRNLAFERV